jgi:hypothetical protein
MVRSHRVGELVVKFVVSPLNSMHHSVVVGEVVDLEEEVGSVVSSGQQLSLVVVPEVMGVKRVVILGKSLVGKDEVLSRERLGHSFLLYPVEVLFENSVFVGVVLKFIFFIKFGKLRIAICSRACRTWQR